MLYDGYKMKPTDAQEELEEVQSDLRKREDEVSQGRSSDFIALLTKYYCSRYCSS